MEIKIGILHASRELVLDTDESTDALAEKVTQAVSDESMLTLTDTRGRKLLVPGSRLAYVEIGTGVAGQVGFRT